LTERVVERRRSVSSILKDMNQLPPEVYLIVCFLNFVQSNQK
jgi:hypothetical protein